MSERLVIRYMRMIKRQQTTDGVPSDVKNYIFDQRLMSHVTWPAWCISITDKGVDYIQMNEQATEEY